MDDELPALGAHLRAQGVHPSMYCSHWFITVFAYTLPFEHLLRVWDIFLFEGLKVSAAEKQLQAQRRTMLPLARGKSTPKIKPASRRLRLAVYTCVPCKICHCCCRPCQPTHCERHWCLIPLSLLHCNDSCCWR